MAVLAPKLVALRSEFNTVFPNRRKESDGWIGDSAHQGSQSGHNPDESGNAEFDDSDSTDEVRALDIDKDLNQRGVTMEMCFQLLLQKCRNGEIDWIEYIIYNRRIVSRNRGWLIRSYSGSNPHTEHMHISGNLGADSSAGRPVGLATLLEDEMELTDNVTMISGNGVTYSDPEWTVEQVLASTHHYVLRVRNAVNVLTTIVTEQGTTISTLTSIVNQILQAVTEADGNPDVASILSGVTERLDALEGRVNTEMRDAIADLGEGGASQVRADQ